MTTSTPSKPPLVTDEVSRSVILTASHTGEANRPTPTNVVDGLTSPPIRIDGS